MLKSTIITTLLFFSLAATAASADVKIGTVNIQKDHDLYQRRKRDHEKAESSLLIKNKKSLKVKKIK
jgi:hypothetical protein